MIRITKQRKNPHLEDIKKFIKDNSVDFSKLGSGAESDSYLFLTNKSIVLNGNILKSGEYVLKIYDNDSILSTKKLEKLELLSKYGLIPKIYIITKKYIIMKYIHGMIYYDFVRSYPEIKDIIDNKIIKLVQIWEKLGFIHDDLNQGNILISDNYSVYFIDPYLESDPLRKITREQYWKDRWRSK